MRSGQARGGKLWEYTEGDGTTGGGGQGGEGGISIELELESYITYI